jgi:uncharacterized membrane protein
MNHVFLLAIGIGIVAGLRSLTAPAFVSWAAHLGWLNLQGTSLAFMGSGITVGIFTLLAIIELVADQLPKTPARTAPVGLIARVIMGGLCGACLYVAANQGIVMGVILGVVGALIGTYGGYYARTGLVNGLKVKDVMIAIPEDIVAIVLAYVIVK